MKIKFAIEYMAVIGNVTVTFPNVIYDNVSTACATNVNKSTGTTLMFVHTYIHTYIYTHQRFY